MEDNMNNEEEFLLKWNNHQSNLIGVFKEWLRDESFVDVTLVCGGEAVSGHKVVLAACSPLLNRILHDNPCRHPVVILNNVCSGDMKALLKFIYQGEVSVSQSELASFLRTADNLQIKGLAEDKEKDDRKRKEKDSDVTGEIRKRRKTEFKVSSQHSQVYNKNLDSVSSSPKSRKNHSPHRDKISSLNSHQTPSGGVHSNSVNNQMVINTDSISHTLEAEYEQSSEQHYKNEELVVKTEPLDYTGEMVWQEGNSLIIKSDSNQDICSATLSNASSSHSLNQHSHSATLPFGVLPPSLENLGSASTTEFIQKSLESFQSGDDKRMEEDGKGGSDEYNQPSVVAGPDGDSRHEARGKSSVGEGHVQILCPPSNAASASLSDDDPRLFDDPSSSFPPFSVVSPFSPTSSSSPSSSLNAYYSMNGTLFSCSNCAFQSRNPYTFNRHLRIHFGTKEFKCSVCDYASTRKDSLIRHFRVKHFIADRALLPAIRPSEEVAFHPV